MASLPDPLQPIPAGRRKLSREVMEEHQRSRIVEAAIDVFAEKGYPATTVDDLVNAASVGVGSFYSLCGGKEECLVAAFEIITNQLREEIAAAAATAPRWGARVAVGLKAILNWIQREPVRARVALVEIQSAGASALHTYEDTLATLAGFLELGREASDGQRQLPETLERTTVNGIAWLLHRRVSALEGGSLDSLYPGLGKLILEPYLGEERARVELAAGALVTSS